jgi:hypothetical protein
VGSLYFIVLPLYQKALLEEGIAKKEVELAVATKAVDRSYSRLRIYAVREFYIAAGPVCSGLFQPPNEPPALGAPQKRRQTRAEFVFAIDVPKCLHDMVTKTTALGELRADDRKVFDAAVTALGTELAERRRVALNAYEKAPSIVTDADIKALPQESYRVQAQATIEKWNAYRLHQQGPTIDIEARRKLAKEIAQERIVLEYDNSILDGLRRLSNVKWAETLELSK